MKSGAVVMVMLDAILNYRAFDAYRRQASDEGVPLPRTWDADERRARSEAERMVNEAVRAIKAELGLSAEAGGRR